MKYGCLIAPVKNRTRNTKGIIKRARFVRFDDGEARADRA